MLICFPASAADDSSLVLLDRIVAVVDEEPIFLSEVERAISLGLVGAADSSDSPQARRLALDRLIEQRLLAQEFSRYGRLEVAPERLAEQVDRVVARLGDPATAEIRLAELGLDRKALEDLLRRQLALFDAVQDRLGPRVFVSPEEIRRHYQEVLLSDLAARGLPPVPLEEVRDAIRALLLEKKLNSELERFLAELRRQADIVDLLERPQPPLPPVSVRFGEVGTPDAPPVP